MPTYTPPDTIRIGGMTYSVSRLPAPCIDGAMGMCDTRTATISLADDLAPEQMASTLLHEVIEAIQLEWELALEHRTIMALERGLFDVLRQHPGLCRVED